MSLIKCGTDENGSYIELRKPRGETPQCFIDSNGVVHDTIRIYEYTVDTLVKLNGIKNKNLINIGQVIKLP